MMVSREKVGVSNNEVRVKSTGVVKRKRGAGRVSPPDT